MGLPPGARFFSTRMELHGELQEQREETRLAAVLDDLRDRLHKEVAAMTTDNFLVRQKRRHMEQFTMRHLCAHGIPSDHPRGDEDPRPRVLSGLLRNM